jgi:hypothetical protein
MVRYLLGLCLIFLCGAVDTCVHLLIVSCLLIRVHVPKGVLCTIPVECPPLYMR